MSAALVDEGSGDPLKSAQVSLRDELHSMMLSSFGKERNKGNIRSNILNCIADAKITSCVITRESG